jgi:hypothetical protein
MPASYRFPIIIALAVTALDVLLFSKFTEFRLPVNAVALANETTPYSDLKTEDEVIFDRDKDGHEIIRITGKNNSKNFSPSPAPHDEPSNNRSYPEQNPPSKYLSVSRPTVKTTVVKSVVGSEPVFTVSSENFIVEIQDNELLGVETAELLEAFYLLFKGELPEISRLPFKKEKLRLKIFKNENDYVAFCSSSAGCSNAPGITRTSFQPFGMTENYGGYVQNHVYMFWKQDKNAYFSILFHEAAHQLLHLHVQKMLPRWLSEGFSVYFQSIDFDNKDIYLTTPYLNCHAGEIGPFLRSGGKPRQIFTWKDLEPSEGMYYGLSASLVGYCMRRRDCRPYLMEMIRKIYSGELAEDALKSTLLNNPGLKVLMDWEQSLRTAQ